MQNPFPREPDKIIINDKAEHYYDGTAFIIMQFLESADTGNIEIKITPEQDDLNSYAIVVAGNDCVSFARCLPFDDEADLAVVPAHNQDGIPSTVTFAATADLQNVFTYCRAKQIELDAGSKPIVCTFPIKPVEIKISSRANNILVYNVYFDLNDKDKKIKVVVRAPNNPLITVDHIDQDFCNIILPYLRSNCVASFPAFGSNYNSSNYEFTSENFRPILDYLNFCKDKLAQLSAPPHGPSL